MLKPRVMIEVPISQHTALRCLLVWSGHWESTACSVVKEGSEKRHLLPDEWSDSNITETNAVVFSIWKERKWPFVHLAVRFGKQMANIYVLGYAKGFSRRLPPFFPLSLFIIVSFLELYSNLEMICFYSAAGQCLTHKGHVVQGGKNVRIGQWWLVSDKAGKAKQNKARQGKGVALKNLKRNTACSLKQKCKIFF